MVYEWYNVTLQRFNVYLNDINDIFIIKIALFKSQNINFFFHPVLIYQKVKNYIRYKIYSTHYISICFPDFSF